MRPFCIATIGGILGIIVGLYFKGIALFVMFFILFIIFMISLFTKLIKKKRKVFAIFFISFILFYSHIYLKENNYANINQKYAQKEVEVQAIVIKDRIEKEYKDVYYIQVIKVGSQEKKQNFKMVLNVKRQKDFIRIWRYGLF